MTDGTISSLLSRSITGRLDAIAMKSSPAVVVHPLRTADDTAVALLALSERKQHPLIQSGVLWLEGTIQDLRSPWSMAWAVLALAAHRRPIESLLTCLSDFPGLSDLADTSTLAVVALALDCHATLSALGVAI